MRFTFRDLIAYITLVAIGISIIAAGRNWIMSTISEVHGPGGAVMIFGASFIIASTVWAALRATR